MSCPQNFTVPEVGFSIPKRTFRNVDFPQPDFPTILISCFEPKDKDKLLRTSLVSELLENETDKL